MAKLLLIDDDQELCQLLQEYLTAEGFSVDLAHDGQQALEQVQKVPYAAIILDVMLPIRSGFEVLKELRQNYRSEEHTSELQSRGHLVCRLLLEKKKNKKA